MILFAAHPSQFQRDGICVLELFVVKAIRTGMPFGWDQDSSYSMG